MADHLPPSSTDITESGSLKIPEPSGPHMPVMGLIYLFFTCYLYLYAKSAELLTLKVQLTVAQLVRNFLVLTKL
jgi:hypothetical protein